MAVPTTIADISTTAASNSPAGSDSIGTSADDFLRSIQAIMKQQVSTGTQLASSTTITPLADGNFINVTGTTTITTIASTNSWNGRVIWMKFTGALQLTHSSTLVMPGARNYTTRANDVLAFVQESSGTWRCMSIQNHRDTVSVKDFGAVGDGVTDDTAAIEAAWAGCYGKLLFPNGTYLISSECTFSGRSQIELIGHRGAQITVTDGAYAGFHIQSSSQHCSVKGLIFRGSETTTPTCTLLKFSGNSAYGIIEDCDFAYASKAVDLQEIYIHKMRNNSYSNCDQYISATTTGSTDFLFDGETFGTTNIGTNPCVEITTASFVRFNGCYWETQNTAKNKSSAKITGNVGHVSFTGCQLDDSGGIECGVTTGVTFTGNILRNAYTDFGSFTTALRLSSSGSAATVSGNMIKVSPAPSDQCSGILSVAAATIVGNYITVASGIGINLAGNSQTVCGNAVTGCTTGLNTQSSLTGCSVTGNHFTSNTTDIVDGYGASIVVGNYATTVTELVSGGYFANVPKRSAVGLRTQKNTTANRPTLTTTDIGVLHLDTTLDADGKPIWWTGTAWVDATGAVV